MTAALRPFRDMLPVEQFDHMLTVHDLPYTQDAALLAEREHEAVHQRRDHDHHHNGAGCEACGAPLDGEHSSLCGYCAATIDHDTEALLEREHFDGWSSLGRICWSPAACGALALLGAPRQASAWALRSRTRRGTTTPAPSAALAAPGGPWRPAHGPRGPWPKPAS